MARPKMTRPIVRPSAHPFEEAPSKPAIASTPESPVQLTPGDRAVTGLIFAIYSTMVVFVGLSLYLAVRFILPHPQPLPTCREDLTNSCGEGMYCRQGNCIPLPNEVCSEGAPCGDACSCLAPSSCGVDQICRAPEATAAPVCTRQMITFVHDLLEYQKNCQTAAGGPLSSCTPQNVENFLLAHQRFDVLLKDFGSSLVFMFPNGRPTLEDAERSDDMWKDPKTQNRYLELTSQQGASLREAKYIIIVGRATRSNIAMDYAYAQSRVRFARDTLLDALAGSKEDGKGAERTAMSAKFIEFALGSDRQLQLEFYRNNLKVPTAWWDDNAPRELTAALTKLEHNTAVTTRERVEAERLINRSVAIFAIPAECVEDG